MKKRTSKSKALKPQPIPVAIPMPPRDYQPSKAEQEAEIAMPGASLKEVGEAFFRPVTIKVKGVKEMRKSKKR